MAEVSANVVNRVVARVRPRAAASDVPPLVLLGWAARMGLMPLVRGVVFMLVRLRSTRPAPLFIGRGVTVLYARQLHLGSAVAIGDHSRINAFSQDGVFLADGVTVRENAWIQLSSHPSRPGEGLEVGPRSYIGPNAIIGVGAAVRIGADCQIGAGVTLISENHATVNDVQSRAGDDAAPLPVTRQGISVGDGCWIGHRVTLLDGVSLGERCVVGAGSVVTRSFPTGSRLAGVPARLIGADS